jgi:hypothetical protein
MEKDIEGIKTVDANVECHAVEPEFDCQLTSKYKHHLDAFLANIESDYKRKLKKLRAKVEKTRKKAEEAQKEYEENFKDFEGAHVLPPTKRKSNACHPFNMDVIECADFQPTILSIHQPYGHHPTTIFYDEPDFDIRSEDIKNMLNSLMTTTTINYNTLNCVEDDTQKQVIQLDDEQIKNLAYEMNYEIVESVNHRISDKRVAHVFNKHFDVLVNEISIRLLKRYQTKIMDKYFSVENAEKEPMTYESSCDDDDNNNELMENPSLQLHSYLEVPCPPFHLPDIKESTENSLVLCMVKHLCRNMHDKIRFADYIECMYRISNKILFTQAYIEFMRSNLVEDFTIVVPMLDSRLDHSVLLLKLSEDALSRERKFIEMTGNELLLP